jgi:hypothetical protein
MRSRREKNNEFTETKRIFRHWVEIRDLKSGSVRQLSLSAVAKIHIPRRRNEPQRPTEEFLEVVDGEEALVAKNLDDLVGQLRRRYPDGAYERTLRRERDRLREEAINKLREILLPRIILEALYVMQAELEREIPDSRTSDAEVEKAAAKRGIAVVDAGKWKQRDTWVHFPSSWIRQILERVASGEISLLDPRPLKRRGRKRAPSKSVRENAF